MNDQSILIERRDGYRVVTLNRPDRLNAFNEAMLVALRAARSTRPKATRAAARS